jgi:hypothetical protein
MLSKLYIRIYILLKIMSSNTSFDDAGTLDIWIKSY